MTKINQEMKNTLIYKLTSAFFYLYLVACFAVFIIPKDILDRCEICLNFTNFMKKYFINIEIFANASSMPQLVEFYMSLLWFVSILIFLILLISALYMDFIKKASYYTSFFMLFVSAIFFLFCIKFIYDFYLMGKILEEGYSAFNKVLYVNLNSKLSVGLWIGWSQVATAVGLALMVAFYITLPYIIIIKLKGINNEK